MIRFGWCAPSPACGGGLGWGTPEGSLVLTPSRRFAPLEQLALSPQCGFESGIGGNTMTIEQQMAKLRLIVETAQEVWGTA